ncbi:putative signal-transduction protein with CBS domains [Pyrobaculum islandicum DSM 4184]|uniref:Signal-transduction protein with CBS domains n=1 Tax=Pyrobaculum islandicum (strain DSM 4184 / JCM 9189 / GEO3) TaxID=384616 RepID=A1RR52_PYRIL|nr:CBS domain-containing protein [Pyrobaculum islandicum]ABL87434.1 putative signal-transduction protein with CBS domains [Pyrobaculum islandicum DSM 4184]
MVASARRVIELIRREPIVALPTETLVGVAEKMAENNIGAVVVISPQDPKKPVGIITERDIVKAVSMHMPLSTPVEAFATNRLITIDENETVEKAAELMLMYNIRHLVVVDNVGRLRGVISIRDVLKALYGKELLHR